MKSDYLMRNAGAKREHESQRRNAGLKREHASLEHNAGALPHELTESVNAMSSVDETRMTSEIKHLTRILRQS